MSKQKANDTVSSLKRDSKIIMSELDRWVESHGNGKYNPADFEPIGALQYILITVFSRYEQK
jgi:hypothetical protein|tara:strand:- start:699 stop:884 length:186 start_codon:yes stop_codon:yes gene_type:complete